MLDHSTDPDHLYWDERVAKGRALREDAEASQYYLGRLALEVETTYGERDLQRYADEIGVEYQTLRSYRQVARAFPQFDARASNLPFTALRILAARDDRERWIASHGTRWVTTRDLQREIAMADASRSSEREPKPRTETITAPKVAYRRIDGFDGWARYQQRAREFIFETFESQPDALEQTSTPDLERVVQEYSEAMEMWGHVGPAAVRVLEARRIAKEGGASGDEDGIERVSDVFEDGPTDFD